MTDKAKIALIVGPTSVGKTAVGVECAIRLDAEIISADSIQIYKTLDIGSAKPGAEDMRGIPHHLMDFYGIGDAKFSVAEFQRLANERITDIVSRKKLPLIVGGTGLYVNSLVFPLDFTSTPANEAFRDEMNALEEARPGSLYWLLKDKDPDSAKRLNYNDRKRIIRALEVLEFSGDGIGTDFSNNADNDIPYEPVMIGLTMPREKLYERINRRVDIMMQSGLLDEVDALLKAGYDPKLPAMQGLGYKQLLAYRRGESTLDEAVELIKRETRRFAKRQLTWFKRDKRIHWLDMSEFKSAAEAANAACSIIAGEEQ